MNFLITNIQNIFRGHLKPENLPRCTFPGRVSGQVDSHPDFPIRQHVTRNPSTRVADESSHPRKPGPDWPEAWLLPVIGSKELEWVTNALFTTQIHLLS